VFIGVLDGDGVAVVEGVKHGVIDGVIDGVSEGKADPFKLNEKKVLLIQVGCCVISGLVKRYNS
jgi:hypothetical protein